MKGELRRFIEESMFSCIKDYNQNNEYKILAEKPKINIDFYGEGIDIDMNFPLTINFEDSVVELSSFRTILPIRLKHILDIKNEILSNNLNYVDFETLLVYDVSISILPYDKNNFVYSIYDEKSNIGVDPFIYNFAVEIDNNINLAPQIKANLTQVAFVDEEFNLNLNIFDNENDTLKFFVDSSLFDFPIQNQILNFIPNDAEIGNYKILIKVSDGFNEVNEYLYLEVRER